ncbi:MAG: hypothetical protein QXJ12_01405 [Candidatus Parvarchaeota archaeon]|nr:hypothetical protein [Candidatus Parvarchaeota archaeon]
MRKKDKLSYRGAYALSISALSLGALFLIASLYMMLNFLSFASSNSVIVSKTVSNYILWELSTLMAVSILLMIFGALFADRIRRRRSRGKK